MDSGLHVLAFRRYFTTQTIIFSPNAVAAATDIETGLYPCDPFSTD
jgi:hypothetical protein